MGIPIKLEAFEGPLDLLLHLIEKNKVNIYDIPIVLITEQYMEYISAMQENNMDVMSEFLDGGYFAEYKVPYASSKGRNRRGRRGRSKTGT